MRGPPPLPSLCFFESHFGLFQKARRPGPPSPRAHRPGRGPSILAWPDPSWAASLLFTARPARWRPLNFLVPLKSLIFLHKKYVLKFPFGSHKYGKMYALNNYERSLYIIINNFHSNKYLPFNFLCIYL